MNRAPQLGDLVKIKGGLPAWRRHKLMFLYFDKFTSMYALDLDEAHDHDLDGWREGAGGRVIGVSGITRHDLELVE